MVVGIYRDTKRRGIYPPLWTEPEGYSCFSTYQISWIKINKKEIFVLKTRSLIGVYYVSIDSVRGIIFIIFLQTQWESFFFRPVNRLSSKLLSLFWYLLVQMLHLPLSCIFRNCRERRRHFETRSKTVKCQGNQSKIAIHWLGEY